MTRLEVSAGKDPTMLKDPSSARRETALVFEFMRLKCSSDIQPENENEILNASSEFFWAARLYAGADWTTETVPGEITVLLERWQSGDVAALDELMPLIYDELRKLAQANLRRKSQAGALQPTALVHEAWMKLASKQKIPFGRRAEFFALASRVMRDMLVDMHRRGQAAKRGGGSVEIPLESASAAEPPRLLEFLVLDDALTRLTSIKPRYTQIVEMRLLGGLTMREVADVLHVSKATAEREWNFARLWLARELEARP